MLGLPWALSFITGNRSWIRFSMPLSKGQGNMKLQKADSPLCHIRVSPEGSAAMVVLMLFIPPAFSRGDELSAPLVTALTVALPLSHRRFGQVAPDGCWQQRRSCRLSRGKVGGCIAALGLVTGFVVLVPHSHHPQPWAHAHTGTVRV